MSEHGSTMETTKASQRVKWRQALPWWCQLVTLILVFAAGGSVGAMITANALHSRMQHYRQHPETLPDDIVPRLQQKLGLTDEQTSQVYTVFQRRHSRIVELRQRTSPEIHREFDAMQREIIALLNDTQREQFHAITQRVRSTFLPPAKAAEGTEDIFHDDK